MKFTDEETIKILKKVSSDELEKLIEDLPEEERGDRSDIRILLNMVSVLLESYTDRNNPKEWEYYKARRIVRIAKREQGADTEFTPEEVYNARSLVNEIERLKALRNRLADRFVG